MLKYGVPAATWIRKLGKRMLKFDFKGYSHENKWVPIGEGDEDWPEVLKAPRRVGYHGWATSEVAGGGEKELRDIAQRMNRVLGLSRGRKPEPRCIGFMNRAIVTITCGDILPADGRHHASHDQGLRRQDRRRLHRVGRLRRPHHAALQEARAGRAAAIQYDRVLYIDTDILVRDDAPDIFAIVPEDQLGVARRRPVLTQTARSGRCSS